MCALSLQTQTRERVPEECGRVRMRSLSIPPHSVARTYINTRQHHEHTGGLSFDGELAMRRVALGASPVAVTFHRPSNTVVVAVNEPWQRPERPPPSNTMTGGDHEPARTYVHELSHLSNTPPTLDQAHSLRIYSGGEVR